MSSGSSSSKPSRFDPLRLLSEIQSESTASAPSYDDPHSPPADEDDNDFMSDKYLSTTESKQTLTYTDKRRKLEAHHSRKEKPKSLKQREKEAREEGLDRDLLAEAEIVAGRGTLPPEGRDGGRRWDLLERREGEEKVFGESGTGEDGTSKAMRMMLTMGYRRGEALGKRMQGTEKQDEVEEEEESDEEEDASRSKEVAAKAGDLASPPDDTDPDSLDTDEEAAARQEEDDAQAREQDEYLTGGVTSSPFSSILTEQHSSNSKTTEPLRPDQRWLVNRRAGIGMIPKPSTAISAAIQSKASSSLLRQQQQAEAVSDYRTRISREHAERHNQHLLFRARKTLIDLDRSSSPTQYSPLWLNSDLYHVLSGQKGQGHALDQGTIDEKLQRDPAFNEDFELLQAAFGSEDAELVREAKTFVELGTKDQLELVLERLRKEYRYCLFCGCQYKDDEDLAVNCPGEEEDDHD